MGHYNFVLPGMQPGFRSRLPRRSATFRGPRDSARRRPLSTGPPPRGQLLFLCSLDGDSGEVPKAPARSCTSTKSSVSFSRLMPPDIDVSPGGPRAVSPYSLVSCDEFIGPPGTLQRPSVLDVKDSCCPRLQEGPRPPRPLVPHANLIVLSLHLFFRLPQHLARRVFHGSGFTVHS